jgi:hypothetical protein
LGILALVLVGGFALSGCKKDSFNESPDFTLQFSTDSVVFDTVFNTIGSATQILKVYNRGKDPVLISNISLVNDPNDSYRINVDGLPGTAFTEVEIAGEDSMFVFIEVTVTPDQDELYPFVDGAIQFQTNGNQQEVKLIAWGWDAIFYYPNVFPTNGLPNFRTVGNGPNETVTWTPDRPIVVFGYVVVDSLQTLIVEAGTQIFFHAGSGLWVYKDGRIQVNGTRENPVTFQGDRLEPFFAEQPGQWDRIWINEGAAGNNHVIKNAIIKNNFIGIQLEPLPFGPNNLSRSQNRIELENVVIRNNSIAGIFSRNYRIDAENLLLSRAGQFLLAATGAGEYRFDHCTFGNNWNLGIRQSPAVFVSNLFAVDENTVAVGNIEGIGFRNCIIHGNSFNELGIEVDTEQATVDLKFRDCIIRVEEETFNTFNPAYFAGNIYVNLDPGFVDFAAGDLRLSEGANAIGKGANAAIGTPAMPNQDIIGTNYNIPRPVGCFEYFVE